MSAWLRLLIRAGVMACALLLTMSAGFTACSGGDDDDDDSEGDDDDATGGDDDSGSAATGADCKTSSDCGDDVCAREIGKCVECTSDFECNGENQICCQLGKPGCTEAYVCKTVTCCQSSKECEAQVCDKAQHYCVDCVQDVDCPEGQVCLPDRTCHTITYCQSSKECDDQVCHTEAGGQGVCVDCERDEDCEAGDQCNPALFVCQPKPPPAPTCTSDKDCTDFDMVCDRNSGICVECLQDTDCTEPGSVCTFNVCTSGGGGVTSNVCGGL